MDKCILFNNELFILDNSNKYHDWKDVTCLINRQWCTMLKLFMIFQNWHMISIMVDGSNDRGFSNIHTFCKCSFAFENHKDETNFFCIR